MYSNDITLLQHNINQTSLETDILNSKVQFNIEIKSIKN